MSKTEFEREIGVIKGDPNKAKPLSDLSELNETITNAFNELILVLSKKT